MPTNFDFVAKKFIGCRRVHPLLGPPIWSVWLCSGGPATRSVPERADEHVRAEHGEGIRVGHHEAMWVMISLLRVDLQVGAAEELRSDLMLFFLMWAATLKGKAQLQKMEKKGQEVEHRCLIRASDGKRSISTSVLWPSWFLVLLLRLVLDKIAGFMHTQSGDCSAVC